MKGCVSFSAGAILWAMLMACYLQSQGGSVFASPPSEEAAANLMAKNEESNQQMEASKRDWNRNLHSWGKRAWQNLQGGWGKRAADSSWTSQYYAPASSAAEKRAWQSLQGGWGKRYNGGGIDNENEMKLRELLALLAEQEEEQQMQQQMQAQGQGQGPSQYLDDDFEANEEEKRGWRSLNGGGWGKRADNWANFRGSWGKRDPAWTNLKGMWGKRSLDRLINSQ